MSRHSLDMPRNAAGNKLWLRLEQSEDTENMELAKWLRGLPPEPLNESVPHSNNTKFSEDALASFTIEHQGEKQVAIQSATDMETKMPT